VTGTAGLLEGHRLPGEAFASPSRDTAMRMTLESAGLK